MKTTFPFYKHAMAAVKNLLTLVFLLSCSLVYSQNPAYDFAVRIGGNAFDGVSDIVVDAQGNSYVTGTYSDSVDFDPSGANTNTVSYGNPEAYIAKYDQSGSFLWVKLLRGYRQSMDNTTPMALHIDKQGSLYITGSYSGTIDFDPSASDTADLTPVALFDIFLAKYDANGNYLWAHSFGSVNSEVASAITTDEQHNVYLSGYFSGLVDFDASAVVDTFRNVLNRDIFISKYDKDGNYIWAKTMGTAFNEEINSMEYSKGFLYVCGDFLAKLDLDPSSDSAFVSIKGGADMFLAKYDTAGNYVWAHCIGSIGSDASRSLDLDKNDNIYLTGSFTTGLDANPNPLVTDTLISKGGTDIILAKFNMEGKYVWAKSIGGTSAQVGTSVKVGSDNIIYLGGNTSGTCDFNPAAGTATIVSYGNSDPFLAAYDTAGIYKWAFQIGGPSTDRMRSIAVDEQGHVYASGDFETQVYFNPIDTSGEQTAIATKDGFFARYSACGIPIITDLSVQGGTATSLQGGATYQWLNCDNNRQAISGATAQSYTTTHNGFYSVVITQGNCKDTSDCYLILIYGINSISNIRAFNVYPNPSTGVFNLQFDNSTQAQLSIYNSIGGLVYSQNVSGTKHLLDLSYLNAGVYFVKATDEGKQYSIKAITIAK